MGEATVRQGGAAPAAGAAERPIFVVGCPRSGTTLLQLMLSAHSRIAIPPENRFVLEAWERRREFGDLRDPRRREELASWIVATPKFKDLGIPKPAARDAIIGAEPTFGAVLAAVLAEHARARGKPRWGDKRPLYLNHLPALARLFPDAQFIHIIRDGRDCVASLKRMPWWKTGSVSAASRWVHSMRIGGRARQHLAPDRYAEVQYEQLVGRPQAELERLCAFLGEDFEPAMLDHQRGDEAVPAYKTWHGRTAEAVGTAAVGRWRQQLEPWEQGVIERVGARHLRAYGYVVDAACPPAPSRAVLTARREIAQRWLRYRLDELVAARVVR